MKVGDYVYFSYRGFEYPVFFNRVQKESWKIYQVKSITKSGKARLANFHCAVNTEKLKVIERDSLLEGLIKEREEYHSHVHDLTLKLSSATYALKSIMNIVADEL